MISRMNAFPKGIVAAIREFGGKFLEYNERENFYFDIGDEQVNIETLHLIFSSLFDNQ